VPETKRKKKARKKEGNGRSPQRALRQSGTEGLVRLEGQKSRNISKADNI